MGGGCYRGSGAVDSVWSRLMWAPSDFAGKQVPILQAKTRWWCIITMIKIMHCLRADSNRGSLSISDMESVKCQVIIC